MFKTIHNIYIRVHCAEKHRTGQIAYVFNLKAHSFPGKEEKNVWSCFGSALGLPRPLGPRAVAGRDDPDHVLAGPVPTRAGGPAPRQPAGPTAPGEAVT
jgi:hypothetical protein